MGLAAPFLVLLALCAATSAPSTPRAATAEVEDVETQLAIARRREARGELAAARDAWLTVAPRLPLGPARDAAVGAARAIEDRLALRAELAAYGTAVPGAFTDLGIGAADVELVEFQGEQMPWVELDIDVLRRAVKIAQVSPSAKRGLVQEALTRGTPAEKIAALQDLAKIHAKSEWPATDVFAAVARARGEELPAGGYVLVKGKWRRAADEATAAATAALDDAMSAFEDADAKSRDAALAQLEARGIDGVARAKAALDAHWKLASDALLRGTTLDQLEQLAVQHAELGARRSAALALIFDEERYFYPYNPPECPPERAKLYAGVQQEVDRLVGLVRDVWNAPRRVRLPTAFRSALERLSWSRATQKARNLEFGWNPSIPAWVVTLDSLSEFVDLASFATDSAGAAALTRDRAVHAFNEATWKKAPTEGVFAPNSEERAQVLVTNAYRAMLGRRVLAWNPRIQAAAQKHADYMSLTGDFGHFEKDPPRYAPADRLKLEGYLLGGSENCHAGDSGAEGAHLGWTHSSGHHRNLLEVNHREMASGLAGPYWCQNFGAGREFESALGIKPAR